MEINKIYCGDALKVLKTFPSESIDTVMTSPPYWALRDYEVEDQIGLESNFNRYISRLCDVFDEVKRVLKPSGSLWINLGDTYSGLGKGAGTDISKSKQTWSFKIKRTKICECCGKEFKGFAFQKFCSSACAGVDNTKREDKGLIKKKSLCMIPERFAISMLDRGWILRNQIIWHKPNSMPSSAIDRLTVDFEKVFFFTKKPKYFFNPVRIPHKEISIKRSARARKSEKLLKGEYSVSYMENYKGYGDLSYKLATGQLRGVNSQGRMMRTVWSISHKGFPGQHYATFPEELVEIVLELGCPEKVCTKCGKPRQKIFKKTGNLVGQKKDSTSKTGLHINVSESSSLLTKKMQETVFTGYTDCGCNAGYKPGIVLDPFIGSGTTGIVALKKNRNFIGIDINKEYCKIAENRLKGWLNQKRLDKWT